MRQAMRSAMLTLFGFCFAAGLARGDVTDPVSFARRPASGDAAAAANPVDTPGTSRKWARWTPLGESTVFASFGAPDLTTSTPTEDTSDPTHFALTYSGSVSGSSYGRYPASDAQTQGLWAGEPDFYLEVRTGPTVTTTRYWFGLSSRDIGNYESNAAVPYFVVRYSTGAANGNWWCCYSNGNGAAGPDSNNEECVDTTLALVASTRYLVHIYKSGTNYRIDLNGAQACVVSAANAKFPDSTDPYGPLTRVTPLAASARNFGFEEAFLWYETLTID